MSSRAKRGICSFTNPKKKADSSGKPRPRNDTFGFFPKPVKPFRLWRAFVVAKATTHKLSRVFEQNQIKLERRHKQEIRGVPKVRGNRAGRVAGQDNFENFRRVVQRIQEAFARLRLQRRNAR